MIFVFGSNLAGRHGKGAAKFALLNHGAIYGKGWGLQGNSFAIPTKDANLVTLSLSFIKGYVDSFIDFAEKNPDLTFQLTPIGCGLAGYKPEHIGPMFKNSPPNVVIPDEFREYI
jgi:hypothetical protein